MHARLPMSLFEGIRLGSYEIATACGLILKSPERWEPGSYFWRNNPVGRKVAKPRNGSAPGVTTVLCANIGSHFCPSPDGF